MRSFELVKDGARKHADKQIKMPIRATKHSAGYDMYSPVDLILERYKPSKDTLEYLNYKGNKQPSHHEFLKLIQGINPMLVLSNISCDFESINHNCRKKYSAKDFEYLYELEK